MLLDVYAHVHSIHHHLADSVISASDDLQNPDRLRSLLKDIREARQAKSREGVKQLDHSELTVRTSYCDSRPTLRLRHS